MAAAKPPRISRIVLGMPLASLLDEDMSDSDLILVVLTMEGLKTRAIKAEARITSLATPSAL
jgi:hypothetical protein